MSKRQKLILITVFLFTFSVFIYPVTIDSFACTGPSYLTLFPPICYTEEMYDTEHDSENVTGEILHDDDTKIKIRFKIAEIVAGWFEKIFKKTHLYVI